MRDPTLGEPLVAGPPYLRAEAVYAARYEMATSLDDVLARRTRALLQARDASDAAARRSPPCSSAELGWDAAETDRQVAAYVALVDAERALRASPPPSTAPWSRRDGHRTATSPWSRRPHPAHRPPGRWSPATARLEARPVPVPDAVLERLASIRPTTTRGRCGRRGQPRLVAARDDLGARRPAAGLAPAPWCPPPLRTRWPPCWRCATKRSSPSPRPGDAAGCAAPRCPSTAGSSSTSVVSRASSTSTRTSLVLDVRPGTFGDHLEHELRTDHGVTLGHWPQSVALVHRRRLVGLPLGRPAVHPLREDRGHGPRPRRGPGRRPADHHRRRAARGGRPGPESALRRLGGHPRHHHRCPVAPPPGARRTSDAPPTPSTPSKAGSTRCGGSCSAAALRRCSGSTTRSRPTARTRPATEPAPRMDEGEGAAVDATMELVAEVCARPSGPTRRTSSTGSSTATTSPRSRP